MAIYQFKVWCEKAASGIVFPPDQRMVYLELMNHLEDHYDDLIAGGMDRDAAQKAALDAMGDPYVIAPQLAAIHKPFWGYFLRATRVVLVIALIALVIPMGIFLWNLDYRDPGHRNFDVYNAASYGEGTGRTLLMLTEPDCSFSDSGYTFTVTDAAHWHNVHTREDGSTVENEFFYFRIVQFNPRPWAGNADAGCWFWAEDSLGNRYYAMNERDQGTDELCIQASCSQTTPLTWEYEMWINDYVSQEAQWLDLHYDRDGRNYVLRIDLTGGEPG